MTSPAQLKYLDAMGIPVWVSRDLIVEDDSAGEPSKLDSENAKNEESMQSILDSLMNTDQGTKPSLSSKEDQNSGERVDVVNKLTQEVVVKTKIDPVENNHSAAPIKRHKGSLDTPHHHVYTSGNNEAEWMVIGHSPESALNVAYEPFAGDAGVLLENMLKAVGIVRPREEAYLVNVFDAHKLSAEISEEGLDRSKEILRQNILSEVQKIKPKIVLLVGQIAAQNLLDNNNPLVIMRSKVYQLSSLNIPSIVTYYPSYLLQKPIDKRKAWEDLKLAMSQIN